MRYWARLWAVTLVSISLAASTRSPADDLAPYRFVEHQPSPRSDRGLVLDGVLRPVLNLSEKEQRFRLERVPAKPVLVFWPGLNSIEGGGALRFDLLLTSPAGKTETLYSKELSEPGWTAERIDLSDRDLAGAELLFRRTPLSGRGITVLLGSGWGDPMLLASNPPRRPSVVLISIDTLRADRLGAYGYTRARTPALDRFAQSGVLYQDAYSPSTWTVPSHASLLAGLHLPMPVGLLESQKLLPANTELPNRPLASILADAGYVTAGFTGGGFLSVTFDFSRGHDTYYQFAPGTDATTACTGQRFDGPEVFRRATEWLRANGARPFYLFVHTYDVHDRCPFCEPGTAPPGGWPELTPERNQELLAYYDRLIADTDQRVGALLATLDELGLAATTLVVITSDHGDAFAEHGQRGHACVLKPYEELTHVPLMLRFPERVPAGVRVTAPVSLIDVAPTILALLGLPPEPRMRGAVLPGLDVAGSRVAPAVYAHCGDLLAVRAGNGKLVTSRSHAFPDEVYDLSSDPGETRNLASARDERTAALRQLATAYWQTAITDPADAAAPKPLQLDEGTKERLRALGYLE